MAGQTAPGDGITIKGDLRIGANDVIIRYIRVRPSASGDAVGARYNKNIILDHVSASWSNDNVVAGSPKVTEDNWKGVNGNNYIRLDSPWPAMAIHQETPEAAYQAALEHAGCSLPNRDAVDKRIIEEVRAGTAEYGNNGIITTPSDVGGWPALATEPAPKDKDGDGMPDEWESRYGLDPKDASDSKQDKDGDGYTNVEEYLNGTDPTDDTLDCKSFSPCQ
jgi:hypothetical protein